MKAVVHVTLKPSILDPQGQSIAKALHGMGFDGVEDVRVGKHIEITLKDGVSKEDAQKQLIEAAQKLLANPVMESFKVDIL